MDTPDEFDINITLNDGALGWPAFPIQSWSQPSASSGSDEFDLDCKYLDSNAARPDQSWTLPVGVGEEAMAVGSGFFGITCSNTCAVGVGGGNTCAVTCSNTCQVLATCGNTCGVTCGHTCQVIATCSATCAVVFGGANTCALTCHPHCAINLGPGTPTSATCGVAGPFGGQNTCQNQSCNASCEC
jgi:hypothetical protein